MIRHVLLRRIDQPQQVCLRGTSQEAASSAVDTLEPISDVQTLRSMVESRATSTNTWLVLPNDPISSAEATRVSFREICEKAAGFCRGLLRTGLLREGRPVFLVFDNDEQFCIALLGCILAGTIPSVRSPPWLYPRFAVEFEQIIDHSKAALIVVADDYLASIPAGCRKFAPCITPTELAGLGDNALGLTPQQRRAGPAIIQYSSGSTRAPLGVALSDDAILSNIRGIGAALETTSTDVVVSWLPVAHDMGLIASLLFTFYWGLPFVLMSPLTFVSKPSRWLWAISRFRGTISPAPNFAFSLCTAAGRVPDEGLVNLDLSSWRAAVCGAETVQWETVRLFSRRFGRYGFREEAFCPAYGLAENSVACTIGSPRHEPGADIVDRLSLETDGCAIPANAAADRRSAALMSTGRPIPGTEVRIVSESGVTTPDRKVGEIEVRGASAMRSYWMSPEATAAVMSAEGWIRTGDLGYMCDGELYVVGRLKQIIKRAGRSYDGVEMAEIVGRVRGVRRGCVSVLGAPDPSLGSERVIVLAEMKDGFGELQTAVQLIIESLCVAFGIGPDEVLLLKPGSLPKTSSGKMQMHQCKMLYASGSLSERSLFRFSGHP